MSNELVLASNHFPVIADGLDRYFRQVNAVPMLTAEEEHELGTRLQEQNDLAAAQRLVLSHLRFVVRIARGYQGYGLPLADLIQEGSVGLMKAVKRFKPERQVRLVSFAVHWIRAEIHEYVLRNWRIVKVATTKAQRKLFFNLRSAKTRLGWFSREEVEGVAKDLGVKPETVLEMEARMSNYDVSFDGHPDEDEDSNHVAPAMYLADNQADPARQLEQDNWEERQLDGLADSLETLDARSRDILMARWMDGDAKATLHELADKYQVSAERIRQIEHSAMKKLRATLEA